MFGLDDSIADLAGGSSLWLVLAVGALLGLRHATDPDHLAAVTTLVAGSPGHAARSAGELGLAWGLGHAVTLLFFGLPLILLNAHLPERAQQAAEVAVAVVIVILSLRLLRRWRSGLFHVHQHEHDERDHIHLHAHVSRSAPAGHGHAHSGRTWFGAFTIGLVHGIGGSASVGVLAVASIDSRPLAVSSLGVLALSTAITMCVLSTGFGAALFLGPVRGTFELVAPALGALCLAFGLWFGASALALAPYPF